MDNEKLINTLNTLGYTIPTEYRYINDISIEQILKRLKGIDKTTLSDIIILILDGCEEVQVIHNESKEKVLENILKLIETSRKYKFDSTIDISEDSLAFDIMYEYIAMNKLLYEKIIDIDDKDSLYIDNKKIIELECVDIDDGKRLKNINTNKIFDVLEIKDNNIIEKEFDTKDNLILYLLKGDYDLVAVADIVALYYYGRHKSELLKTNKDFIEFTWICGMIVQDLKLNRADIIKYKKVYESNINVVDEIKYHINDIKTTTKIGLKAIEKKLED